MPRPMHLIMGALCASGAVVVLSACGGGVPVASGAASKAVAPVSSIAASTNPVAGSAGVKVVENGKLGKFLADENGRTLYSYSKDELGASNCYGGCAKAWPPLTSTAKPALPQALTGTLDLLARKDGPSQVTYNKIPLYHFVKDTKPGDTFGQGIGGIWFVVTPGEKGIPAAKTAAQPTAGSPSPKASG